MASYIGVSPPEQTGIVERYQFTGDGSTTVFSGNDNNGKEFRYISTNTLLVFLNGVQLVEDTDFTKTSNSQITFTVAPTAADELELLTFGSFDLNSPSTLRTDLGLELANGKILLGNSSGVSTQVTPSGDATLSNAGVITLADTYRIPGKLAGTNFTGSLLIGHSTTGTLNAATYNTGVGLGVLDALTSGDSNTALGHNALSTNTVGGGNTAIGRDALLSNNNGGDLTAVGFQALRLNSGSNSTAVGKNALVSNSTGSRNTALGVTALGSVAAGDGNIGIGYTSGNNITSGSGNVVIGVADVASATGDKQFKISDGEDGSVVWLTGDSSGNVTVAGKIITGDTELQSGAKNNISVGTSNLEVYGSSNGMRLYVKNGGVEFVAAGSEGGMGHGAIALRGQIVLVGGNSSRGFAFGRNVGWGDVHTIGQDDIKIKGDTVITTGDVTLANDKKVIFGDAGEYIVGDGTNLNIVSSNALGIDVPNGITLDSGSGGTTLRAGGGTTYGTLTSSSGDFSINQTTSDKDIIFTGNDGGSTITALTLDMSEAGNATFNGTVSMSGGQAIPGKVQGTNFTDSILIGHSTTGTLNAADNNTGVGIGALNAITSADNNVAIGKDAGGSLTTGAQNVAIGSDAMLTASTNASYSTAIGYYSMRDGTGGFGNTGIGYHTLRDVTGRDNIAIGINSGRNITDGSGNIFIGTYLDADNSTDSRKLKIAGYDGTTRTTWLSGDSSGNLTTIGDVTLANDKKVIFGDAGENIVGDGTKITIASSNSITLDAVTDIILDADGQGGGGGGDIIFRDGGLEYGRVENNSGNIAIANRTSNTWYNIIEASNNNDLTMPGNITVGGNILPTTDATQDLGSTSKRWNNIYTGDLHLSNESTKSGNSIDGTKGNWTLQEGQSDLFLINNNTGKKYKFKIEEIE